MPRTRIPALRWLEYQQKAFLLLVSIVILSSIFSIKDDILIAGEAWINYIAPEDSFFVNRYNRECLNYGEINYCHQVSPANHDFFFNPPFEFDPDISERNKLRSEAVKGAFVHAWGSYKKFAWGHDNIAPLTFKPSDDWQGWGITLVDSLDTLLLMGLDEEYKVALESVEKIDFTKADSPVMVFESIIRYLGGLLGAYDLKADPILLKQAVTLAKTLLPAFETGTGFPAHKISLLTGSLHGMNGRNDRKVNLAEIGTLQLEFHRLSQITKDPTYANIAQRIIDRLDALPVDPPGLYPLFFDMETENVVSSAVSFGAMGDSFYEYLLKRYLLTNKTEEQYRRMYVESIDSLHKHLVEQRESKHDDMFLLAELSVSGQIVYRMDHLACFVPGMLGLGAISLNRTQDHLLGQELTTTCRQLYQMTATGLGPESVGWTPTPKELSKRQARSGKHSRNHGGSTPTPYRKGFHINDARYLLRPETLESIFYMYRLTGNPIYQDWAWEIFQAIDSKCRVEGGFAEYHDVREAGKFVSQRPLRNSMESFFLAETLKYLYLIFMPPSHLSLQEYVLTTEAHPLRISSHRLV